MLLAFLAAKSATAFAAFPQYTLNILGVVNPLGCDDRHYVGINNRSEIAFGSTSAKEFIASRGVAPQVYPPGNDFFTKKALNDVGKYVGASNESDA